MRKQFESLTASELHCPRCKTLRPVRERLLLVLPGMEVHDYRCVVCGESLLDLPYVEDSKAEVDMNVVATGSGLVVEVQATAEGPPVERSVFDGLLDLALDGCKTLTTIQRDALDSAGVR